jgi:hypothetical protein
VPLLLGCTCQPVGQLLTFIATSVAALTVVPLKGVPVVLAEKTTDIADLQ